MKKDKYPGTMKVFHEFIFNDHGIALWYLGQLFRYTKKKKFAFHTERSIYKFMKMVSEYDHFIEYSTQPSSKFKNSVKKLMENNKSLISKSSNRFHIKPIAKITDTYKSDGIFYLKIFKGDVCVAHFERVIF